MLPKTRNNHILALDPNVSIPPQRGQSFYVIVLWVRRFDLLLTMSRRWWWLEGERHLFWTQVTRSQQAEQKKSKLQMNKVPEQSINYPPPF